MFVFIYCISRSSSTRIKNVSVIIQFVSRKLLLHVLLFRYNFVIIFLSVACTIFSVFDLLFAVSSTKSRLTIAFDGCNLFLEPNKLLLTSTNISILFSPYYILKTVNVMTMHQTAPKFQNLMKHLKHLKNQ